MDYFSKFNLRLNQFKDRESSSQRHLHVPFFKPSWCVRAPANVLLLYTLLTHSFCSTENQQRLPSTRIQTRTPLPLRKQRRLLESVTLSLQAAVVRALEAQPLVPTVVTEAPHHVAGHRKPSDLLMLP